jgi:hypothetical protein
MVRDSLIRRLGFFARRHGWDGGIALLFCAGLVFGGRAIVTGAVVFGSGLVPSMPAQASDQPAHAAQGVARLPMYGFAGPSRYAPAVLFPVTAHALPSWMRLGSSEHGLGPAPNASLKRAPPVIAIVMDDLGEDLAGTDRAMMLPKEVTLSFLPYADATPFLAQEAEAKGHDVLAHVPMQALSNTDPGPMTLSVGAPDIAARLQWHLARVPGLIGINNHEGSRFTQDAASLAPVVQILAQKKLFFLDSRTGAGTKVMAVAQSRGVTSGERDIFLDDTVTPDAVRQQLDALVAVARRRGAAIAIGHPHDVTLTVLAAWLAQNHGVTLVRLPEAMARKAQAALVASR